MNTSLKFKITVILSIIGILLIWTPINIKLGYENIVLGGHIWYADNKEFVAASVFSIFSSLFFIVMPLLFLRLLKDFNDEKEVSIEN
ncbi:MAG: hypothetical protein J7K23_01810 [Thermoproteales archaeon]|nr:hypothetical protein [Thermoproteales archaeon]